MGICYKQPRDKIFIAGFHARPALTATALCSVHRQWHPLYIATVADGNDHIFLLDQVLVVLITKLIGDFSPARISKPFLVDQGRPEVAGEVRDGTLTGIAADKVSNVVRVEVSFDGEPPVLASSGDGVFDGQQEAFELRLPPDLLKGRHTLLIQATDEAGNTGVQRLTVGP